MRLCRIELGRQFQYAGGDDQLAHCQRFAARREVGGRVVGDEVAEVIAHHYLDALNAIPEGSGTLLDNCLIFAHSDCSIAKAHAVEGIPMMVAGNAGGRVKTGFHMAGRADPASGPC